MFNTTKLLYHMAPSVELIMKSEQSDTDNHRVMQQSGASAFYMVVH